MTIIITINSFEMHETNKFVVREAAIAAVIVHTVQCAPKKCVHLIEFASRTQITSVLNDKNNDHHSTLSLLIVIDQSNCK